MSSPTPVCDAYSGRCTTPPPTTPTTTPPSTPPPDNHLPVTGGDAVLILLLAMGLLAAGIVLASLGRRGKAVDTSSS